MATYTAQVAWALGEGEDFARGRYSRAHILSFDGGAQIDASSSPHVVPAPWSVESAVDPEEMFVAAVANCHMLTFLHKAREAGLRVLGYRDHAVGVMEPNAVGRLAITRITLRPEVIYDGAAPSTEASEALHHAAHRDCFIANSVTTDIQVEGRAAVG
ncbi:OsmC family protein [Phenylobacterium sp.]|uniref:OsmC family protein n=1 Tax=Phenylobacterium sp. TaxID=1871053 RepID=UPI0027358E2F|nr:OsmC family protein [Phenylobacterium sp.]MDP3661122.1 OsmC family protein [Phenylobacterium sp.]